MEIQAESQDEGKMMMRRIALFVKEKISTWNDTRDLADKVFLALK
jgi:hypothetical protein